MGCDVHSRHLSVRTHVSIHAPTWGATLWQFNFFQVSVVSIHAPTWGATNIAPTIQKGMMFQSTHPHGVRLHCTLLSFGYREFQSTHPHGVRRFPSSYPIAEERFNPRTHMGCDALGLLLFFVFIKFQSTHPHGVRPMERIIITFKSEVSIHAPTWGATTDIYITGCIAGVSIHAPTWGATYKV